MTKGRKVVEESNKRKELTLQILKGIGLAGLVITTLAFPGIAILAKMFEDRSGFRGRRARRAFHDLRRSGSIGTKKSSDGVKIILTDKGKKKLERLELKHLTIPKPQIWDGQWRLVMFDVPEPVSWSRNRIRSILKHLGFISIQKSVFIHPYPCVDVIDFLRSYYRLRSGELYIFESKVLEGEKELRKYFKI